MDQSELDERERELGKNAIIVATSRYYDVATESGFGLLWVDPDCEHALLDASATDAAVGSAILAAVSKSRFLTIEEADSFANRRAREIRNKGELNAKLRMERYGYKNETQMNKDTKYVNVTLAKGKFTIDPSHTDGLGSYTGVSARNQKVVIPGGSLPTKIGAAFRLALSRCTSIYDKR